MTCVHCGTPAHLDRCHWCERCARDLAHGLGAFRHLREPTPQSELKAALVLDRIRFRQVLAAVVGGP